MNMTDTIKNTLASALDFIASEIDSTSLDTFLEANHQDCKYICETLQLTPLQAALFATILEKSGDDLATTRELVSTLKVSKIRFLGFKKEIDELTKKRLVVARQKRSGSMGYRVSQSVVKAIQYDSAIEPERLDGLSTRTIFNRFHGIFADLANGVSSSEIALQEIFDIMNNNPENRFVEASMRLGMHGLGSPEETVMIFYMLHRIVSFNDNEFTTEELSRLFDDPMGLNDFIYDAMRKGESSLQSKGLIEFHCEDGLENREAFQVPQAIQDELFVDLVAKGAQSKVNIPKDELICHDDIRLKKMFYNELEAEQVESLTELLGAEKFAQVQDRLREKGLRSGFCCLFYGPAGTGKTETVMQIAKETGRDIFIVDMSRLKSKWVGDSEKNIKQLFRTYKNIAKESELAPILLFNEADAIFGKRIREESSTDKMNNAIQNIILQEMETLDGIMIATTNLTCNLDKAFERRFIYKIEFERPTVEAKQQIWRTMIPSLSETFAHSLAKEYDLSGGQIENIARKRTVELILTGNEPSEGQIREYCQGEMISSKQDKRTRIGF